MTLKEYFTNLLQLHKRKTQGGSRSGDSECQYESDEEEVLREESEGSG